MPRFSFLNAGRRSALPVACSLLIPAATALSCAEATVMDPDEFAAGSGGSLGAAGSLNQSGSSAGGSAGSTLGIAGTPGTSGAPGSAGSGTAGSSSGGSGAGAGGMPSAGAGGMPSAGAGTAGMAGSGGGSAGSAGSGGAAVAGSGGMSGSAGSAGSGGAASCNAACTGLKAAIVHRYSFDGSGTTVEDTIGTADGVVVNTTLGGSGSLVLAGGTSDQYVDLPNGIISALSNATFEMWVNLAGVGNYSRVFDFGSSSMGEGLQGSGQTYVFLYSGIAVSANDAYNARVTITNTGSGGETRLYRTPMGPLPFNTTAHVAVVLDDTADMMHLYVDSVLAGSVAQTIQLSTIVDVNNWLGRSQYQNDTELQGEFLEFRIYNAALTLAQLQYSFAQGADATFFD